MVTRRILTSPSGSHYCQSASFYNYLGFSPIPALPYSVFSLSDFQSSNLLPTNTNTDTDEPLPGRPHNWTPCTLYCLLGRDICLLVSPPVCCLIFFPCLRSSSILVDPAIKTRVVPDCPSVIQHIFIRWDENYINPSTTCPFAYCDLFVSSFVFFFNLTTHLTHASGQLRVLRARVILLHPVVSTLVSSDTIPYLT